MSTKLSAESIATLIAALCASTTIACAESATTSAPPVTAKEVAAERQVPPREPEQAAMSVKLIESEDASEAEPNAGPREALIASPAAEETPPEPVAEPSRPAPKKAPSKKKAVAAQGGCGAGTCA